MVNLEVVPHEARHLIIVGTSLRKPKQILEPYLQSLAWQVRPRNVDLRFVFVDDGLDPDSKALVNHFLGKWGGALIVSGEPVVGDFSDHHPITHQWSDPAMQRVGRNKDRILGVAREERAEAVWLADADLIMDPMTLTSLWSVQEQIACAVYWTRWSKNPPELEPVHAGPQVWQGHPYTLGGNGMEEWELRRKLINRQIVHVYGQGACTLIRKEALEKGVAFAPVPGNTAPGLMQGEDRHFCIRAEALHLKMVADGWPDIFHIYHRPDDEKLIPEMLQRLERRVYPDDRFDKGDFRQIDGRAHPAVGDLISLKLKALEPFQTAQGLAYSPSQMVRGRLGTLAMHPEMEQAVSDMSRGEQRVVPVHFGLDYPFALYRGKRRLIQIDLIDHKPHGFPPVVDQEVIRSDIGGWSDTIRLNEDQIDQLREVHATP